MTTTDGTRPADSQAAPNPTEQLSAAIDGRLDEVLERRVREIIEQLEEEREAQRVPWPLRIFGLALIAFSLVQFVIMLLAVVGAVFMGMEGASPIGTTALIGVYAVISVATAILMFVFGVRLLSNKRRRSAAITHTLIYLVVAQVVLTLMMSGVDTSVFISLGFIVVLAVLETYLDPSIREERELQRALRKLEERSDEEERIEGLRRPGGEDRPFELNFFNLFWTFVVAAIIGLILEIIFHLVTVGGFQSRAGLLWGPFSPIYGFGAVLMTIGLNGIRDKHPVIIFLLSGLIGSVFEYFVSWFMETAFGVICWDYSGSFLNINGRVNLFFFLCWGVLGLIWVRYLLPLMFRLIYKIPLGWRYAVTGVCVAFMLTNGIMTLLSFDRWYERRQGVEANTPIAQFIDKHYDNDFMHRRFENMEFAESSTRIDNPGAVSEPIELPEAAGSTE